MASPLRAFMAAKGKTLFEFIPEVQFTRGKGRPGFDLIVFPAGRPAKLLKALARAPGPEAPLWRRGVIVFDASAEGTEASEGLVRAIDDFLAARGIARGRAVYITQDRQFASDHAQICRRCGLAGIDIATYDYFIRRVLAEFEADGAARFEARLARFRARPGVRDRAFVSLNLTPRPSKLVLLLSLIRDGLWERGYVSFGGLDRGAPKGKGAEAVIEGLMGDPAFGAAAQALRPWLPVLEGLGEVLLGGGAGSRTSTGVAKLTEDAALPEYQQSWFSVVTETEMRARPSRITEKPLKALANFHPILILGNPGSLALLRGLGFQTFDGVFDEGYDLEPDPLRRFGMVYDQVTRLCAMDPESLARRFDAAAERSVFNADHLLNRLPARFRLEFDLPLVERLRSMRDRPLG